MKSAFFIVLFFYTSLLAQAELIQILHTNDLHGHLEGLNDEEKKGGFAQLKFKMDSLRRAALDQGIESLVLDAGDFSEGNIFYKANNGQDSFELMKIMGYDAIAVGNHDYLMGTKKLDDLLKYSNLPFVAANLKIEQRFKHIHQSLQPSRWFQKNNLKIAVVGGTSNEVFYTWIVKHSKFSSPIKSVNKEAKKLMHQGADLIIGLTHIGFEKDVELAKKSQNLDLIIGGHSHTKMDEILFQKNANKKFVPIVQTGEHGKYIGEILIDVDKSKVHGEKMKVLSYKLHPIFQNESKDSEVNAFILKSREHLNQAYGENFLTEVIGESDIPMVALKNKNTYWTAFYTKAIEEAAGADISINNHEFFGVKQLPGPITREKIMNFYPRFFDLDNHMGWNIYTSTVVGTWLEMMIKMSVRFGYPFIASGISFDLVQDRRGDLEPINIKFQGEPIDQFHMYKIAFPEGFLRGVLEVSPVLGFVFRMSRNTQIPIWKAVEDKINKVKVVRSDDIQLSQFKNFGDLSQENFLQEDGPWAQDSLVDQVESF
jgi:5'-nucleotidase/UDP-sugar diphosphatase